MAGTMEQKGKHCAATHNIYLGTEDKPVSEGLAPHMTLTTTICATAKPPQGHWAAIFSRNSDSILGRQTNIPTFFFLALRQGLLKRGQSRTHYAHLALVATIWP